MTKSNPIDIIETLLKMELHSIWSHSQTKPEHRQVTESKYINHVSTLKFCHMNTRSGADYTVDR